MCGIAGIISSKNELIEKSRIKSMTDRMSHRGPDSEGFFLSGEVALGHRRLSIIDLSDSANQPFSDVHKRYTMVFNGEIYNYNEIKPLLGNYPFRTSGDTEVLIAAYAKWGTTCLDYLRGMFSFAIWDEQEKEMFIARDRMGVKPLYYFAAENYFVFASEIRGILASGLAEARIDPEALLEYFTYQSIGSSFSTIAGIRQLEAGSWMKIKNLKIEKGVYWDVTKENIDFDFADQQGVRQKIKELMLQSVKRRLVSDVPVGAFLSGGIDSSAVVGLMVEAGNTTPNTFNIAFDEQDYDESHYADIVARKFNTRHTRILLKPTVFLDELQNGLDAMDTPSGDGINTYVVSKAIRKQGITVALSGVGGDELFAGYPLFSHYLQLQHKSWLWKLPPAFRRAVAATMITGNKKDRLQQLLRADSYSIADAYPVFRQILSPNRVQELTSLSPSSFTTVLQQHLRQKKHDLQQLPLLSQVSASEYLGYTQDTLLKDTDQMSMAVSLEVREPFFDQDLVTFVLSVPDSLKKPAYPKSLLVESLKPLLPEEVVFRKKQGFLFPWNSWLRKELRPFCETHIHNMAQRSFIHGDRLSAVWKRFLQGDKSIRWPEIWLFVVLEYWMEKNNVS